jgi:enhancing lycopene biosynthesis protein 2
MPGPKIGVLLSGCGVKDGSEIHEAVLTLLEIARLDAEAVCLAPDGPIAQVMDHALDRPSGESRTMLSESARISRGRIQDVARVTARDLDALILPGGFGAATNLCTFATAGADCNVHPQVERLLLEMHAAGKPIGAICIAPAVVARVFGRAHKKVRLTIGDDPATASKLTAMGAEHVVRRVDEIVVDEANRIVSTPAYMLANRIDEIHAGIAALVREVVRLAV